MKKDICLLAPGQLLVVKSKFNNVLAPIIIYGPASENNEFVRSKAIIVPGDQVFLVFGIEDQVVYLFFTRTDGSVALKRVFRREILLHFSVLA